MRPGYQIHHDTLDNGLQVVVAPDPAVPSVSVNLWVDVGSRHEEPGRTGLAHLFEHLMFQGSAHVAEGEHVSVLMAHGGRANATTWFDRTTYVETVPTGALELALWLEADRHGRLLEAVTQQNLDNQRDVVVEEKRQRYDNQPYGTALADLGALVYPPGHPYHHPTIGSMEDLGAASLDDVHDFYRRHYGPDTTVVTLVGDVTPQEGLALVERHLGQLSPGRRGRQPVGEVLGPLPAPVRTERVGDVPHDRLVLGFRLPVAPTEELVAASIALDALAGLAISRLERRLVREAEVATGIGTALLELIDGASLGYLGVDVCDGVAPEEVEELLCAELERFAAEGPSEVEMEASLADTERCWLEVLAGQDDRADLLSHYTLLHDDPQRVNTYLDVVAGVGAEAVAAAASAWLRPEHRATVTFRTEGSGAGGAA